MTHNVDEDQRIETLPDFPDKYDAVEFIGRGGMGSVYKALDKTSGETVAIKVLRPELAADKLSVKRFEQEVTAASELRHPNLIHVHHSSKTSNGVPYLVMNFVDGEGLDEILLFDRFMPTERAINIFVQTARALEHAHSKGIVHRDMKPSNILISKSASEGDHAVIVDFGIAKVLAPNIQQTQITQSGELFGSPLYMSPEQCSGQVLDVRSDIYSMGCVMYEVLCGKPPFSEENPFQVMLKQVQSEPPSLRSTNPSLVLHKDFVEYLVMRCLEKEPSARYQSISEVLQDLEKIQQRKRIKRRLQTSRRLKQMVKLVLLLVISFCLSWSVFSLLSHVSGNGTVPNVR